MQNVELFQEFRARIL